MSDATGKIDDATVMYNKLEAICEGFGGKYTQQLKEAGCTHITLASATAELLTDIGVNPFDAHYIVSHFKSISEINSNIPRPVFSNDTIQKAKEFTFRLKSIWLNTNGIWKYNTTSCNTIFIGENANFYLFITNKHCVSAFSPKTRGMLLCRSSIEISEDLEWFEEASEHKKDENSMEIEWFKQMQPYDKETNVMTAYLNTIRYPKTANDVNIAILFVSKSQPIPIPFENRLEALLKYITKTNKNANQTATTTIITDASDLHQLHVNQWHLLCGQQMYVASTNKIRCVPTEVVAKTSDDKTLITALTAGVRLCGGGLFMVDKGTEHISLVGLDREDATPKTASVVTQILAFNKQALASCFDSPLQYTLPITTPTILHVCSNPDGMKNDYVNAMRKISETMEPSQITTVKTVEKDRSRFSEPTTPLKENLQSTLW